MFVDMVRLIIIYLYHIQLFNCHYISMIYLFPYIVCFLYLYRIASTLIYYGLTINSADIAGNKYLNFALASFIEIPSCILYWLITEKMSRKMSLSSMFLLTSVTCIFYNFTSKGEYLPTLLGIILISIIRFLLFIGIFFFLGL